MNNLPFNGEFSGGSYGTFLKTTLNPRLSHVLALVVDARPSDPLEFIATHLHHLKLETRKADDKVRRMHTSL